MRRSALWGGELLHPWVVLAVITLVINDHLLKGSGWLPTVVTGKFSDVAGLFFFPILLVALARGASRLAVGRLPRNKRGLAGVAVLTTGVGFTLVNLSPPFNLFVEKWWGVMTMDPWDLLTLPILWVSYRFMISPRRNQEARRWLRWQRRRRGRGVSWAQFALATGAGLASIATPAQDPCRPKQVRNYPAWQIMEPAQTVRGCAQLDGWISRSGKEGLGLTVRVRNIDEESCLVELTTARVEVDGAVYAGTFVDAEEIIVLGAGEEQHHYAPVFFPSEELWNADLRKGRLEIAFDVGGSLRTWSLAIEHYFDDPYRFISPCEDVSRDYLRGMR